MRSGIGPADEFLASPLLRLAPPVFSWSASVGLTKTRGRCLWTERRGELTPRGRLRLEPVYGGWGSYLVDAATGASEALPYLAGYGSVAWLPGL